MASPRIPVFPESDMRRIADTVRGWEGKVRPIPKQEPDDTARGLQVRFGITVSHESSYPSAPASVFYWKPLLRKPEALTAGDQELTETESDQVRIGVSFFGGYIAQGVVVEAYKIGGYWWLRPFPGSMWGTSTTTISARSGSTIGTGSVKIYSLGATWTVVQSEGADLVVTAYNAYTSSIASGKTVKLSIDSFSGLYGVAGGDC